MALPKLEVPKYMMTVPSTGDEIEFRPFLVREEKILLLAMEEQTEKATHNAVLDLVHSCTFGNLGKKSDPMFDIEYVFLRIRGKSVGEKVKLSLLCPDDEKTRVEVEVNLEEVDVQMQKDHTNIVELSKDITMVMKYPCLKDMTGFDDEGEIKNLFEMIKRCVHEIRQGETVYNRVDISDKELDEFIESMSSSNFEDITNFFNTMPKLQHVIDVTNPNTKKVSEIPIEGLQSFFE